MTDEVLTTHNLKIHQVQPKQFEQAGATLRRGQAFQRFGNPQLIAELDEHNYRPDSTGGSGGMAAILLVSSEQVRAYSSGVL